MVQMSYTGPEAEHSPLEIVWLFFGINALLQAKNILSSAFQPPPLNLIPSPLPD